MKVVGLDPAFANFGMVAGHLGTSDGEWQFHPMDMELLQTQGEPKKTRVTRKSSETLRRSQELNQGLRSFLDKVHPDVVFVEVPSGAQNANAAMGLGVAVGVLGSITVPVFEVAPTEIKALFTNRRESVPKQRVMEWAYKLWPDAPWMVHGGRRTLANEHLADACAAVVAGVRTPMFQQAWAMRRGPADTSWTRRVRLTGD